MRYILQPLRLISIHIERALCQWVKEGAGVHVSGQDSWSMKKSREKGGGGGVDFDVNKYVANNSVDAFVKFSEVHVRKELNFCWLYSEVFM